MKEKWLILIIALLTFVGCVAFFSRDNKEGSEDSSWLTFAGGELLVSSKEGYNSVEIYKQENKLVIYLKSESAFFDDTQLTVETQGDISPEDVEIIWTTLGGGTEKTENNDLIIMEIKIYENDELSFDTKVNFAKKAFEAIEELWQKQIK